MRGLSKKPRILVATILAFLAGCSDGGKKVTDPGPIGDPIEITRLSPARTVGGDTLRVTGSGFGQSESGSAVSFATTGGRANGAVLSWSETSITVLVPAQVVDGPVRVEVGAGSSNDRAFDAADRLISYEDDLLGLFEAKGCVSCHGGTNGLYLESAIEASAGNSLHGPVIIPRDSAGSILLQKTGPNPPFGDRMPLGCSGGVCLTDEQRLTIADWIDQGARDN